MFKPTKKGELEIQLPSFLIRTDNASTHINAILQSQPRAWCHTAVSSRGHGNGYVRLEQGFATGRHHPSVRAA